MNFQSSSQIYLAKSTIANAGRGVFASTLIKVGTIIERCPIIFLRKEDYPLAKQTSLLNYYFLNEAKDRAAIALGYGSLYNHSYTPNATYEKHLEEGYIDFIALKGIAQDEEITVNYNYGNPEDKSDLWIEEIPGYRIDEEG